MMPNNLFLVDSPKTRLELRKTNTCIAFITSQIRKTKKTATFNYFFFCFANY